MKRKTMLIGLSFLVVGVSFAVWSSATASTRSVQASWITAPSGDPHWHVQPGYVQVTAWSDTGADHTIDVRISDATGALVCESSTSNDATTPFDGAADPIHLKADLANYGSGQTFACTGKFRDSSGALLATVSTSFTKP